MFSFRIFHRPAFASGLLVTLALAVGCRSVTGADDGSPWRRRVGVVVLFSGIQSPLPLVAPVEATRGEPFAVTVTTYGSGNCTRPSGGEVQYESGGTVAVVTPYDEYYEGRDGVCTDDLRPYPRQLTLRVDVAGTARIRLVARVHGLGVGEPTAPTLVTEHAITIR